jgi:hypothetical protein
LHESSSLQVSSSTQVPSGAADAMVVRGASVGAVKAPSEGELGGAAARVSALERKNEAERDGPAIEQGLTAIDISGLGLAHEV